MYSCTITRMALKNTHKLLSGTCVTKTRPQRSSRSVSYWGQQQQQQLASQLASFLGVDLGWLLSIASFLGVDARGDNVLQPIMLRAESAWGLSSSNKAYNYYYITPTDSGSSVLCGRRFARQNSASVLVDRGLNCLDRSTLSCFPSAHHQVGRGKKQRCLLFV